MPGTPSKMLLGSATPRYSEVPIVIRPWNSMPPAPSDSGASTTRKCLYGSAPSFLLEHLQRRGRVLQHRLPTVASRVA